jgi:hypothetical protein
LTYFGNEIFFTQVGVPPADLALERGPLSKNKSVNRATIGVHDLSNLLKDSPPGAWVALSHDEKRIVGTATSMQAAAFQAQLNGEENPLLVRMPLAGEGLAAGVR